MEVWMRRNLRFLVVVLVVMAATAASSLAQEIAAYGSYYNVDSNYDSWGAGGYLGIPTLTLGPVSLMLEGRAGYLWDVAGENSKVNLIPLEAVFSLKFLSESLLSPYLGLGAGAYIFDVPSDSVDISDRAGWYAVGGTDIALSKNWALKFELLWRDTTGTVDFSNHSYSSSHADIQGLAGNAGLAFRF
jgi:opacity protein-like surface antigen